MCRYTHDLPSMMVVFDCLLATRVGAEDEQVEAVRGRPIRRVVMIMTPLLMMRMMRMMTMMVTMMMTRTMMMTMMTMMTMTMLDDDA